MKYSKQRELIFHAIVEHPVHPTADFIYSFLRSNNPNISLGTVYRNLNLLSEHGLIHRIPMPGASDRFDGRTDEHYHMVCEDCGTVYDVELGTMQPLDQKILQKTGFFVKSHELILRGLCDTCRKNKADQTLEANTAPSVRLV